MPPLSWPDYVKQISRRSKAGYSSVHNELLQRFGTTPAKDLSYRDIDTKQQSKQNRMSFFRIKSKSKDGQDISGGKPKERKLNSLRGTFISYVEEEEGENAEIDKEDTVSENVFVGRELREETSTQNTDLDEGSMANADFNDASGSILKLEMSEPDSAKPKSDIQTSDDTKTKSPSTPKAHLSPKHTFTEEAIYQVPRARPNAGGVDNAGFEGMAGANDQHLYSNLEKLAESGHYEVPKSPRKIDDTSEIGNGDITESNVPSYVTIYDNAKLTHAKIPHLEDDYIDMQGTVSRDRYKSCSAIEGKLDAQYENTTSVLETLQIKTTRSAPNSPVMRSLKPIGSCTERGQIAGDSSDETNVYVEPDPVERKTTRTPQSATVTPYIPETEPSTTSLSSALTTRPFIQYSVEEVVECFEICALHQVAEVCKKESLDGEYFKDLNDSDLTAEPFCLSQFHVSKVRRIIAGWRPKRQTY